MKTIPLIVPIDNRVDLLPFHAAYYAKLGFRLFVYALWNADNNPVRDRIPEQFKKGANGIDGCEMHIRSSIVCDYDHYNGPAETPGLNTIRMEFAKHEEWYCVADLDEFYYFDGKNLEELVQYLESRDFMAIHGLFYDRIAGDESFPAIPEYVPGRAQLDELFPCVANLSKITMCGNTKIALARLTGIRSGHHFATLPADKVLNHSMQAHHFKWHAGVLDLLLKRHKAYGSQNLSHAHESREFYDFLSKPGWIHDPRLNTREAVKLGI